MRFGEKNDLCDTFSTKIPGIRGGPTVRGKGALKKVQEEKELDLVLWRIFNLLKGSVGECEGEGESLDK